MRLRTCIWVLGICLCAPIGASAQAVYFSAGNEIRTLNAAAPGTPTLVHTSPMFVGDLALCAGNPANTADASAQYLYFVERDAVGGDRISRLNVNAPPTKKALVNSTAQTLFTVPVADGPVGEIRLTIGCEVMFATAKAVFQISGSTPTIPPATATAVKNASGINIVTNAGSGLAVAFDGSLRYSDGATLKATLASGFTSPTTTATPPATDPPAIVGVGVASGGAGSVATKLPSPTAVGPVCVSTENRVACGPKPGGNLGTTLATFAVSGSTAVNNAQFFEFLTNDTAIVATSVNPTAGLGGSARFNGILWRVVGNSVIELARGAKVNGEYVPIVGVAAGPSAASATTASSTAHEVNFGPVAFDAVTPLACSLTITLRQLSWVQAHAKIDPLNTGFTTPKYLLDRGLGGESWVDDVDVVPTGNCGLTTATPALVGIAQYNDNSRSRAVLHCSGTNPCEVATHGNYPYSTPDDERDSALPDNFSDFLTATIASPTAPLRFSSPLNNLAIVNGAIDGEIAAASSHNASGGLSIRFRICLDSTCTTFAPAESPNPPLTGAGLSVTRLTNTGVPMADCLVIDQGSSTPDLPVFRTTDSDGVAHNFNLDTPIDGPSPCQLADVPNGQTGLFVATVFSHGGTFTKTSILFKLAK